MPKLNEKVLYIIKKGDARKFVQEDSGEVWFVNLDGQNCLVIYITTGTVSKICVDKKQDFGEQITEMALDEHSRVQVNSCDYYIEPRKNGSIVIGTRWKKIGAQG